MAAPPTTGGLALRGVRIGLRGTTLIDIDAAIAPGEVLTVMGRSGAGKSTLLAYIAGFLDPAFSAAGEVLLDGAAIQLLPAQARGVGLLFQDPLLFPHLSVGGNLLFGMPRQAGAGRSVRWGMMLAALDSAGLAGFEARDPATLSGGQKARAALLRLMLSRPRAVLLDEPFSALDATLRDDIRTLVFGQIRRAGLPCLLVTHDAEDAASAGGTVIELG
jgi:putative thiamine transport system ATP-binding protein